MSSGVLADVAIVLLTSSAIWLGSGWLEAASDRLATHYGLPQVVQGAVIAAVGSSMPELATVVIAGLAGSLALGVGGIVGSAIFNVLVIPALAGLLTDDPIESNRTLVYKEAQFYMLAVSVLLITFALGVIYYPVDGVALAGTITRPLAVLPLALYGLYVFIQYQDTADHRASTVPPTDGDDTDPRRQWGLLAAGLVVIVVAVHFLVESVSALAETFGIPAFLLGVTIIAAATSLPDALVSVRAAREDRGVTSLANVLGSNTFDLLVAIPVGVLIVGDAAVDFAMAVPMFGVLTAATIALFTALRTDLWLSDREALGLLGIYALFVGWVVLETLDVLVDLLPNA
ncbi:sodium/calcium exchanger membrane region [Halorhabdus utahensis DSM 12940]|uniref:Sodium/calcium exchanger membrane region n=1 Tax=Halorhabdus utahensis (strain DSM 12940 / JCM 11049 / AX-2) TaxID=519442 RepID=C7NN93_HALUD|nr:sodium:calcium antiporter [Halorhabdus utahensis]ACV11493.1 sodium/calcium exchanger membrane region [Halorhabdus utahensis DSM 12940]